MNMRPLVIRTCSVSQSSSVYYSNLISGKQRTLNRHSMMPVGWRKRAKTEIFATDHFFMSSLLDIYPFFHLFPRATGTNTMFVAPAGGCWADVQQEGFGAQLHIRHQDHRPGLLPGR